MLGDADFFPNGVQPLPPGCLSITCNYLLLLLSLLSGVVLTIYIILGAHQRAPEFYAESVYPGNEFNFLGVKCGSLAALNGKYCPGKPIPMGYATPHNLKGNYFLKTNEESPFGQNSTKDFKPVCNE